MKMFIGIVVGAAAGFAFGYFSRCTTGMCPLTKNPWVSTFIGALFGLMMTVKR